MILSEIVALLIGVVVISIPVVCAWNRSLAPRPIPVANGDGGDVNELAEAARDLEDQDVA